MRVIRSLSEILCQENAVNLLRQALRKKTLAHSYIFCGPEGVGKETTARAIIYHLYCHFSQEEPCGSCLPCRKLDKGIHPDVKVLEPDKRDIRIDSIREIDNFLRYRPLEAPYKVILILQAEKLNPQAGNALLKSLEEPPLYALFILITERIDQLLPTIVSRSQIVRFRPLKREIIRDYLIKFLQFDDSVADTLSWLSMGSLGKALTIAESGLLEDLNSLIQAGLSGRRTLRFKIAEKLAKRPREELELLLTLLGLWIWKSYISKKTDLPYSLRTLTDLTFEGNPHQIIGFLGKARQALNYFVSPELLLYVTMDQLRASSPNLPLTKAEKSYIKD